MSSSPELVHSSAKGVPSRSRPRVKRASANTKDAHPYNVVELTDFEKEPDDVFPLKKMRKLTEAKLGGGQTGHLAESSSGSMNNTATAKRKPDPAPLPLFLQSDEEKQSPERDLDTHPSPLQDRSATLPSRIEESYGHDTDPTSKYLGQVLEVVPDVDPEHAAAMITQHLLTRTVNDVVAAVIEVLFDNGSYPKVDRKGKRKILESDDGQRKRAHLDEPDYASLDREYEGGIHYAELAVEQLMTDFPDVPKPYIRKLLASQKDLYAPTHLHLAAEKLRGPPYSYTPKKTPSRPKGKHKVLEDPEFKRERDWLVRKLEGQKVDGDAPTSVPATKDISQEASEDADDSIECGCCFSTYPFGIMIQCNDGHLFCTECMTSYSENLLGSHNPNIVCMDQSGCKYPFPESELRRFLSSKLMSLYERVRQTKEIEMAGLEGLEECPFCEFKCVIENPEEKLFRCGNLEECGAITCRQCKKPDHLPKSCKEMEEDRILDGRHSIEEAMTRALMRNCPKCQKSFIKEDGCNKMTCPNCQTLSCYVCRKIIAGYNHFNQAPPGTPGSSANANKCPLWEPTENRHANDVRQAAEKAMNEYKRDNPDVDERDIKVDVPVAPLQPTQHGYMPGLPRPNPYADAVQGAVPFHANHHAAQNLGMMYGAGLPQGFNLGLMIPAPIQAPVQAPRFLPVPPAVGAPQAARRMPAAPAKRARRKHR